MDLVALGQEEFGEVAAVLAGDTGDECSFSAEVLMVLSCRTEPDPIKTNEAFRTVPPE